MCGKEFEPKGLRYLCDDCSRDYQPGMPLKGVLEAMYNYAAIAEAWGMQPDISLFNAVSSPDTCGQYAILLCSAPGRKASLRQSDDKE